MNLVDFSRCRKRTNSKCLQWFKLVTNFPSRCIPHWSHCHAPSLNAEILSQTPVLATPLPLFLLSPPPLLGRIYMMHREVLLPSYQNLGANLNDLQTRAPTNFDRGRLLQNPVPGIRVFWSASRKTRFREEKFDEWVSQSKSEPATCFDSFYWECATVGLKRSSTSRNQVAVVLSCYDKGNKLALKLSAAIHQHRRPLLNNPETVQITIDIPMLQALMSRFAQGAPTLGLDVYVSPDPYRPIVSFGFNKGGGNT